MDSGYVETEHLLRVLEFRINEHYGQAEREIQQKIEKFYADFARLDEKNRTKVKNGELSKADYTEWRKNKMIMGKRWENMKEVIATDLYHKNDLAQSMVFGFMPEVYATNHNYGTYEIERKGINTGYTLYDAEAVERLMSENPDLIPIKYRKIHEATDIRWNRKNCQSVMIQAILQGESIPDIAKRFSRVIGQKNKATCIRNARTMTTSARNAGRNDAYERAARLGVKQIREWCATHDGRTRDSHRWLDREQRAIGEPFSNGLLYPADPNGAPAEVYNCRCRIKSIPQGLTPRARATYDDAIMGMSYEEWKKGHNATHIMPKAQPKHVMPKKAVKDVVKEMFTPDTPSKNYQRIKDRIANNKTKIAYLAVEKLKEALPFDKIIERVAGGDDTSGSCSSLTYAYIANKMGYDVLDFRNGGSRKFFSMFMNTNTINQLDGIKREIYKVGNSARLTAEKLKELDLPHDKEYRLSVGKHAAIIRNTENGYEYLELQSGVKNGWHSFEKRDIYKWEYDENGKYYLTIAETKDCTMEEALRKRFGCQAYESMFGGDMELTEVDSYYNTEFIDLMGYINTKENKQRKSIYGHER